MTIWIDSREKPRAITKILHEFDRQGVKYFVSKLPVGDYTTLENPKRVIDRKQNLQEICGNVIQQHSRFIAELERANDYGIELIILCEHGGDIKTLPDVMRWVNPRLKESPLAVSGERLFKILSTISKRYNVTFLFCDKQNTGKRIIEILSEK